MKNKYIIYKQLLLPLLFILSGVILSVANNFVPLSTTTQEKKVKVLFIFNNTKGKELTAIVKHSYLDKPENAEKFYKTYPNHFFYPGYVIRKTANTKTGSKKIINGIFEEPKVGDLLIIYAQTEKGSAKQEETRIPFDCEKKGEQCTHLTDTDLKVDLQIIEDLWSADKTYSAKSTYKINAIQKGTRYVEQLSFNKPLYGKDKH